MPSVVESAVNCVAPLSVLLGVFLYLRSVVLMHSNQRTLMSAFLYPSLEDTSSCIRYLSITRKLRIDIRTIIVHFSRAVCFLSS